MYASSATQGLELQQPLGSYQGVRFLYGPAQGNLSYRVLVPQEGCETRREGTAGGHGGQEAEGTESVGFPGTEVVPVHGHQIPRSGRHRLGLMQREGKVCVSNNKTSCMLCSYKL